MSLYKKAEDVILSVKINERKKESETIQLDFYADCGKFGTNEILDSFDLTPKELIDILQEHENNKPIIDSVKMKEV